MMKEVLVFRFSALGDVAMSIPVLVQLTEQNPGLQIRMVSRPAFEPLFRNLEQIEFIGKNIDNDYRGVIGLRKLSQELANYGEYVADLHGVTRTRILKFWMGPVYSKWETIDKGRIEKKMLTRHSKKEIYPLRTTHQRYADVFKKLGLSIELEPGLRNFMHRRKDDRVIPHKDKRVGIAPFAKHPSKQYPLPKMKNVISALNDAGVSVFLFGNGEYEREKMMEWEEKYAHVLVVKEKDLQAELEFMSGMDLMISMDSANMHLASLVGVRVLSIWGGTHPFAGFMGYGQNMEDVIQADHPLRPTSVYGNSHDSERLMAEYFAIPPENIVEKVLSRLEDHSKL